MKPDKDKSILSSSFPYTPSHKTDVTKTWDKARKKLEEEKAKRDRIVSQLPKRCPK